MYYIAFFKVLRKNLIVPKQWIKDIKLHKEKFYNKSLNRSQAFVCFYTNDPNAFDDDMLPKGDFEPNFNANMCTDTQINCDGLFTIKLVAYRASREGAIEFLTRHRNVQPGIYNPNRLRETPIPETQDEYDVLTYSSSDEEPSFEEIIIPNNRNVSNIGLDNSANPLGLSTINATGSDEVASSAANNIEKANSQNDFDGDVSNIGLDNSANPLSLSSINATGSDAVASSAASNIEMANSQNDCDGDVSNIGLDNSANPLSLSLINATGSGAVAISAASNIEKTNDQNDSEGARFLEENIIPNNCNVSKIGLGNSENSLGLSTNNAIGFETNVTIAANNMEKSNNQNASCSTEHVFPTVSITVARGAVDIMESADSNDVIPAFGHVTAQKNESPINQTEPIKFDVSSNEATTSIYSRTTVENAIQQTVDNSQNTAAEHNQSTVQNVYAEKSDDLKPNIVPFYEVHQAKRNAILEQLEDKIVEIVDDMEITITSKGFGKPLNTTAEGFLKLEQPDEISGNIPFLNAKNGRVYKIGKRFMEIPYEVFSQFGKWNKPPLSVDLSCDKRFVSVLIFALTDDDDLKKNNIPEEVKQFVQELLEIRCGNEKKRMDAFPKYLKELCASETKGEDMAGKSNNETE